MSGFDEICAAKLVPVEILHVEHLAQFLTAERQEWLEGDGEIGYQLQRDVQHSLHALRIGLPYLPRLTVGDVLIADACQVHGLLLSITELEVVQQVLHLCLHVLKLGDGLLVILSQFATLRHYAIPIFLSELQSTIHKVAIDSHQLAVVALLEVLPHEVVVLGFRCIGSKHIAQHILLAREIYQIFVEPHSPVLRGGNLVVLQIQKFVGRHIVGHDVLTMGLHHGREDDAVEHDVVLADEVHQTSVFILPPFLPCAPLLRLTVAQLFSVADVADRGIKPHIEHLAFGTLYRHWDTPIQVACHSTWLQVHVKPRLALAIDVGSPLLVAFQNPLLQPVLILIQRQIPVFRLTQHRHLTCLFGARIDQFCWLQSAPAAFFALVAIRLLVAVRAFAHHITVGKELLALLVVELHAGLLYQLAFVIELAEEIGCKLMMNLGSRTTVDVE